MSPTRHVFRLAHNERTHALDLHFPDNSYLKTKESNECHCTASMLPTMPHLTPPSLHFGQTKDSLSKWQQ